jgi:hypothetical protein
MQQPRSQEGMCVWAVVVLNRRVLWDVGWALAMLLSIN